MPGAQAGSFDRLLEGSVLVRSVLWFWRRRLTQRGRFLLVSGVLLGLLGLDTRRALVFILFCVAAAPLVVALPQFVRRDPPLRFAGRLPARLTAGRWLSAAFEASPEPGRRLGPLSLAWGGPLPRGVSAECSTTYLDEPGERGVRFRVRLRAELRGHYLLPQLGLARTDTFGLVRGRGLWMPRASLVVYPRYYPIEAPQLRAGRRYQPGGIPLASTVGESLEFAGTREYRHGDPPRKIHWRSSARLGRPVVKEYLEEYFSRLALVLDTYLPKRRNAADARRLEAAIVVLASLAEHYGRSEDVVDVLAAGPDLYEVSTGRSLGALDNVLEVLAGLRSCPEPAFETIAPHLFERLAQLNTVVAVLLDWDERREAFVGRLAELGVSVHVLLVHGGKTRLPWPPARGAVAFRRIPPDEVAAALDAQEAS